MGYERGEFRLIVSSPPDRIDISVEVWVGPTQIAEVYDDPGYPVVEFFQTKTPPIAIKAEDIQDLLARAVAILASRPRKK